MFWPPYIRRPDHPLGELHRDAPLAELDPHDGDQDADGSSDQQAEHEPAPLSRRMRVVAVRAARTTTEAKMIIDMPLPMPRWLISSPIHISSAVPATSGEMITR